MECFEEKPWERTWMGIYFKIQKAFSYQQIYKMYFYSVSHINGFKAWEQVFFLKGWHDFHRMSILFWLLHIFISYTVTRLVSKDRDLLYKIRSRPTARCIFLWTFLHVLILWTRTTSFLKRMVGENGGLKVPTCYVKIFSCSSLKHFLNG